MYVCLCKGITDNQIRDAVNSGAESVRAVKEQLGVASQCGKCRSLCRDIVSETLNQGSDMGLGAGFYQVA